MRVTQQDIARYAQVSQATVSRVVSGDVRVEPEIRDKVLTVMAEHNYRPDVRAQSLRKRSTNLVGLAIQRPHAELSDDPFFTSLISEILKRLSGTPYQLCLETIPSDVRPSVVYDEMLRSRRVDGLLLVESEVDDERIRLLQSDRFPFVLIGNPLGQAVWSVDTDNVYAGKVAAMHLFWQGFRRVAFIAGRPGVTVSEDRIQGFCEAAADVDVEPMVFRAEFGIEAARQATLRALESPNPPEALLVLDDYMAIGVVSAAQERGLRIPYDLALVSFNDTSICRMLECGLTSVNLNLGDIVDRALTRLISLITCKPDDRPVRETVHCELRIRGSSIRQVDGGRS